jgi:hypothetical protein
LIQIQFTQLLWVLVVLLELQILQMALTEAIRFLIALHLLAVVVAQA